MSFEKLCPLRNIYMSDISLRQNNMSSQNLKKIFVV